MLAFLAPCLALAQTPQWPTPQDIERMDELKLEDFDVDLRHVELPHKPEGERLTTQELDTAVDSFLSALRER